MAIYLKEDLVKLLNGHYVLLLGDSVQRSIYKDFVALSQGNRFLSQSELKKKGEDTFLGDRLVHRSELTNGIGYREEREYYNEEADLTFKFCFITRIYNDYVKNILRKIEDGTEAIPSVVIINSCLWDISRYGRDGMISYRKNLTDFSKRLKSALPPDTLVIWRTTLPVSQDIKGGFMTLDSEWCRDSLRLDVLRANYYAYNIVRQYGYNVIDLHYHFRHQVHRQARDGVHWNMYAHRRVTNIILTNIAMAWDYIIPKLPWHDDSKVNFNESDVIMNRTNVLREAYSPLVTIKPLLPKCKPPLLPTPHAGQFSLHPLMESPGSVPHLHTTGSQFSPHHQNDHSKLFYTDAYTIPEESPVARGDIYQILTPSLTHNANVFLPTGPYPSNSPFQANAGPVRNHRRRNIVKGYSRPGKASEMLKMRLQKERRIEERICMKGRAVSLINCHNKNASKYPSAGNNRIFIERSPAYYSSYTHRY